RVRRSSRRHRGTEEHGEEESRDHREGPHSGRTSGFIRITCPCCGETFPREPEVSCQNIMESAPPQTWVPVPQSAPSTWVKSLGVPLSLRHLEMAVPLAQTEQTHCGVSTRPSKDSPLDPSASVGWKRPRVCPLSWAAVSAMTSGPQPRLK